MTSTSILVIDTSVATLAEAEHLLLGLGQAVPLPDDAWLATHEIRDEDPHYAFSLTVAHHAARDLLGAVTDFCSSAYAEGAGLVACDAADVGACDAPGGFASAGLAQARDEAVRRSAGRLVRFPGQTDLVGTLTLAEARRLSAIDRFEQLGGGEPDDSTGLVTRDFLRPRWRDGALVLAVLPAGAGLVAPFEVPDPTPCCGDHRLAFVTRRESTASPATTGVG